MQCRTLLYPGVFSAALVSVAEVGLAWDQRTLHALRGAANVALPFDNPPLPLHADNYLDTRLT